MKAYIIMEIGWKYDDEYFYTYRPDPEGGIPRVAYESREDARVACAAMTAEKLAQPTTRRPTMEDDEGKTITEFYEIKMVEMYGE